jgi:hypothetical protein
MQWASPVAAARCATEVLALGGTVMIIEPFANDRVEYNLSPVARLYYSASTTLCSAHAVSEGGHLVLGAQARGGVVLLRFSARPVSLTSAGPLKRLST